MNKKNMLLLFLVSFFITFILATAYQMAFSGADRSKESPAPLSISKDKKENTQQALSITEASVISESMTAQMASPVTQAEDWVLYQGTVYHVFYHFLIAFPDVAYASSYGKFLDIVCVTPLEFTRSLKELYKNGYVLVDINKLITLEKDADGKEKIVRTPIMLPKGKKPLIISFDDINYYSKNHGMGIGDRIVLDEQGNFAMQTLQKDGTSLLTYDNDVIPLLEQFITDHPDFSPSGVRGTLALTGYDGILGYRIQTDSPRRKEELEALKPVVEALKKQGWNFASHSYGHIHTRKVSLAHVKDDTRKWADQVASVVGETLVYVYPYGEHAANSSKKFNVLYKQGFRIFCGVGMRPYLKKSDSFLFMDRINIDGYSLRNYSNLLEDLMDSEVVFDSEGRYEKI